MIENDQWKERIPTIPEGVVLFTILPEEEGFWFPTTCIEVTVDDRVYGCKHIGASPKHIQDAMIPLDRQYVYAVVRHMAKEVGEQCPALHTLCDDVKEWTLPKTASLMRAKYQF